jgi:hypothetical protein
MFPPLFRNQIVGWEEKNGLRSEPVGASAAIITSIGKIS